MTITAIQLERFTTFQKNRIEFSPGLNVFIGANGTGKTHLMKVAYAACDISKTKQDYAEKLIRVFLPRSARWAVWSNVRRGVPVAMLRCSGMI